MAKPGPARRNTTQDDYKVKVIDRRSKYQQDTEQILSKGLSKAEMDKSLTTLRKEFIADLRKLSNDNITKAISSFYSKQNKKENKPVVQSVKATELEKGVKELTAKADEKLGGINQLFGEFKGLKTLVGEKTEGLVSKFTSYMGSSGLGTVASILGKVYTTLGQISSGINSLFTGSINQAISDQMTNMGKINARLYGLTEQFDNVTASDHDYYEDLMGDITSKFLNNSYVNQTDLWKKISDLVSNGIGFNVEERAYIATLSDKLVETFNVNETNLLKAIRLNQFDLTQSQLGAEALLLEYFNKNFQDSSYLSNMYDTVYGSIQDALSQMNYADSTEFNYNVQKWLGSLYEVGASESLISQLASGINMLATGDVSGLEGNTSLQNMLVMGATKAGLSYSSLLTNGLDSDTLNQLMGSIISYLQDIADNTDNEVVKNAWKGIVGVGVSDLRAIQNLSDDTIESLTGTTATFEDAINATLTQFKALEGENRVSTSERISNQMNNLLYSVGATLVNNESLYEEYRKVGMVQDIISYLSSGLGVAGDLIEAFTSPINSMLQNNAILKAFTEVMNEAGYNYSAEDLAAEVTENIGETLDSTTASPTVLTEDSLASLIEATRAEGDYQNSTIYGEDLFATAYKNVGGESAALKAFSYANSKGYVWMPIDEYEEQYPNGTPYLSSETTQDNFTDLGPNGEEQYNWYANAVQQTGANWVWVNPNGNGMTYDDYLALTDGSVIGADEIARTVAEYNAADLDEAANNIVTSDRSYGWADLLRIIMNSGWDPINNGLGANPFGSTTAYTRRGQSIYGITSEGTLDTTNLVGSTTDLASYIGESIASNAQYSTVTGGTTESLAMISDVADNFDTFGTNEAQIQAQTEVITSVQEDTSKTLEELYTALFVDGRMISVSLLNVGADVWGMIDDKIDKATSSIKARLDETINVNVESGSSTNYFDTVASTKGW